MVVPPAMAVAVGEAVSGAPLITVTSGLAVALGVGLGASTHLVTFSPSAATLVVQKEPCAKALGATTRTVSKVNEANVNILLTNAPLPRPVTVDSHPKRNQHQRQHEATEGDWGF
jgi:hypothetical protein